MRKFRALLVKELRELLTPQVLVPFVVVIAMFSVIGQIVGEETEKAMESRSLAVADLDASPASATVLEALSGSGFAVTELTAEAAAGLPEGLAEDTRLAVVIPSGFGEGLAEGAPQQLETYAVMRGFSMGAMREAEELKGVLQAVNESVSARLLAESAPGVDPVALRSPVVLSEHVTVGGRTAQASASEVVGFVTSQTTFIPIVLFMVIVFAAQMIATTIATEKENKTLETLLSVPVSRVSLVTAKMVAAGLVALVSAAVYILGMRSYMSGITGMEIGAGGPSGALSELGLTLGAGEYALLGLSLFFGILTALGISVILGAFAENVKAVQSLLAPLMILIMVPYFLTLFVDIESASPALRWLIQAIPFSHSFMAAPRLFLDERWAVVAGIGYQAAWFVVFAVAAARIFSTDRILTMKLRLGRRS